MICYLCNAELTESNRSPEHIIPDALGNNITSDHLLCGDCNHGLASRIDSEFIKFHGYLYDMVLQARLNSRVGDKMTGLLRSGEKVNFGPEMKMDTSVEIPTPNGESIKFSAPSDKAEKKAHRILKQLSAKYPHIDPDKVLANASRSQEVLEELVFFSNHTAEQSMTGGPAFFRGIKKIAINFYLSKGLDIIYIKDTINQVREGVGAPKRASTFYYPTIRPVHILGKSEISHVIKLVGNTQMRVLYCYVEIFNVSHSLILLNENYDGPPVDEQYCYDVLSSKHLYKDISLPFGHREHVTNQFDFETDTNAAGQAAYNRTRSVLHDILREKGLIR
ncbi:HNH endonuclease [uncultured Hymenobacter sp.]|uniref:HNH endonuclease n=1 Tax=uncultured Hymenobacter sp. TaxID=170016 RepID=UPI0035CBEFDB